MTNETFDDMPMFPQGTTRYFYQDGARFYLFDTPEEARGDAALTGELQEVTYPFSVPDFDVAAATAARDWFVTVWCPRNNANCIYCGE